MPTTSVPNSSGAMIIRIMRMKIWLNGRMMLVIASLVVVERADDVANDQTENQAQHDLRGSGTSAASTRVCCHWGGRFYTDFRGGTFDSGSR